MGQHFLRDTGVARSIAAALPDAPDRVLEIGPGWGALTRFLLARFPFVKAVELDRALADRLAERLGSPSGLEVLRSDALAVDLDELSGGVAWSVAANLPYSVGTAIVRRLLWRGDLFPTMVLMLQREVAERMVASPGDRRRGLLSLEVELHSRAEMLFSVPAHAFSPPPRVWSAVIRLDVFAGPPAPLTARVLQLAGAAFTQRRKKLANALSGVRDPEAVREAMARVGVEEGARAEHLSRDDWERLAGALAQPGPEA
jgi:16S rRNA (adenine1518-N6/adenine1519-N6)-dimethyltransferase